MFRNWSFLMGEMWILLILAALLGLLAGWIIWGRRSEVNIDTGEADTLRADLEACRSKQADKDARIAKIKGELDACRTAQTRLEADLAAAPAPVVAPVAVPAVPDAPAAPAEVAVDYDGDGVIEGEHEGTRPEALSGPRGGTADDLKRIKGIGPKMERLCNELGFYHFDQIASWTPDEEAWVNANLEGFKGRVSRDEWISQAKLLAEGGETEFSKKVDKGDVY